MSGEVYTGSSGGFSGSYPPGAWNSDYSSVQSQNPKCIKQQSTWPTGSNGDSSNLHWRFSDNGHGRNGCCGSNTAENLLLFIRPWSGAN